MAIYGLILEIRTITECTKISIHCIGQTDRDRILKLNFSNLEIQAINVQRLDCMLVGELFSIFLEFLKGCPNWKAIFKF